MNTRLTNIPVYESASAEIAAARYNRVRLALARLGCPLSMHINELKHMSLILENDAWICVDEVFNEFPVVAWTDFQTRDRQGLHMAVPCRVLKYHEHADRIMATVMNAMDRMLEEQLHPRP